MTAWNFSSFYCEYIDFFDIESIRAIVDEVPKARLNSFAAFDYFFFVKAVYNPLDPFNLEIIDLTKKLKLLFEKKKCAVLPL